MSVRRRLSWAAAAGLGLIGLSCLGWGFPLEGIQTLLFGWVRFVRRVAPAVRIDAASVATGLFLLGLFTAGLHCFLAWLYGAMHPETPADGATGVTQRVTWQFRWTTQAVFVVLLMFAARICGVGLAHQLTWLVNSPEPVLRSSFDDGRQMMSRNHLNQIGLSAAFYHDDFKALPAGVRTSPAGAALHGWQTALLPYGEQKALFEKIDLTKPWDDPSQREAFETRVPQYLSPVRTLRDKADSGYALSHYSANQHVMGGTARRSLASITDGTSNTLLVGEAAENFKPWGHPRNWRDPMLGLNATPDGFSSPWPAGVLFVFGDGRVQMLSDKIDPQVLRALSTPAGGEPVGEY